MWLTHSQNRRMRSATATVLAGLSGLVLAGCSVFGFGGTDPTLYDRVDAVMAELDLESAGKIVHEGHYGTGEFSSDMPTAEVLLELRGGFEVVQQTINDADFTNSGTMAWERGSGESTIWVRIALVGAGEVVTTGAGGDIEVDTDSVLLAVKSSK